MSWLWSQSRSERTKPQGLIVFGLSLGFLGFLLVSFGFFWSLLGSPWFSAAFPLVPLVSFTDLFSRLVPTVEWEQWLRTALLIFWTCAMPESNSPVFFLVLLAFLYFPLSTST